MSASNLRQLVQHCLIAIAHDQKPTFLQIVRAPTVTFGFFRQVVDFTINFNSQPNWQAHKIGNVVVNGMLSPKARA
jgi:hypothetical protein